MAENGEHTLTVDIRGRCYADWLGFDPTRHELTDEQRRETDALINRPSPSTSVGDDRG